MVKSTKWLKHCLLWSAVAVMATSVVTPYTRAEESTSTTEVDTSELSSEELLLIQQIYNTIQSNYIQEVDKKTLLEGAIKGMVNAVGDPYSEYFNAEESNAFNTDLSDSFEGIGVQFAIKNDQVTVISPIDDTPASKAGLQTNDIIVSADGVELAGKTSNEVVQLIRGPKGTEVKLTIQRGSQTFEVTVQRDTIPVYSVTGELDKDHKEIGVIRISQFAEKTASELEEKVKELRNQGAKRFIFDLRSNPGGLLDQALKITNMFSKDGDVMFQVEERGQKPEQFKASILQGLFKITEPYVFLVNEGSASASEVVAGMISENTNHPLIGVTTFGKGTVQNISNQSDFGELKLTIAKWLTPQGNWVHEKGIEPDIKVEQDPVSKAVLLDTTMELKKGTQSELTESLALMLNALGYPVNSQGYFDDEMEQAVKHYQKDKQLEETGIVVGETAQQIMDDVHHYLEENDAQYQAAVEQVLKEQ